MRSNLNYILGRFDPTVARHLLRTINRPPDPRVREQLILDHQCLPEIEALN
jgi:hypothetical protein